ncbi:toll/interleukin-1 receptor domain-containing protein [Candidatus Gottesmanbacteria bacterium]|nr:toll/interleukin-1 receptor domain-containing protein [Candidatus Gottesmanbacteria bacterium]
MDRINCFLSFSSKQEKLAGRIDVFLHSYCGYDTFLAHDHIQGGTIWEEEICKAIEVCDLFIPLLSSAFRESEFTDQEIGMAVCLKKRIIPVKFESINPYGFINKYQALEYKILSQSYYHPDNMSELALAIGQIGLAYNKKSLIYKKVVNSLVYAFCKSKSFDSTNAVIQLIMKCKDLSKNHLNEIAMAIKANPQVSKSFGLPSLVNFLQTMYNFHID